MWKGPPQRSRAHPQGLCKIAWSLATHPHRRAVTRCHTQAHDASDAALCSQALECLVTRRFTGRAVPTYCPVFVRTYGACPCPVRSPVAADYTFPVVYNVCSRERLAGCQRPSVLVTMFACVQVHRPVLRPVIPHPMSCAPFRDVVVLGHNVRGAQCSGGTVVRGL